MSFFVPGCNIFPFLRLIKEKQVNIRETEKEFIDVIRKNSRLIYKVCTVYTADKELIEDTFQDIVVNLWCSFPSFRGECKIQTWIYRVSLNTCINHLRKKKRTPERMPVLCVEEIASGTSPYTHAKELYELINQLSGMEKAFITLYLDDKCHEEIAEIMGISKNNVAVKLHRIKEKLLQLSNK